MVDVILALTVQREPFPTLPTTADDRMATGDGFTPRELHIWPAIAATTAAFRLFRILGFAPNNNSRLLGIHGVPVTTHTRARTHTEQCKINPSSEIDNTCHACIVNFNRLLTVLQDQINRS